MDTLQEALTDVMSLPAESLEDPLRLEAEVDDALGEAAVQHLPPAPCSATTCRATTRTGKGWVALPAQGSGCRRYRRSARRLRRRRSPGLARAEIVLPGADTLEERLLDAGVGTLAGQRRGAGLRDHARHPPRPPRRRRGRRGPDAEFEELSPATAGRCSAGRPWARGPASRAAPGRRYFRLVVPGGASSAAAAGSRCGCGTSWPSPELRVHLRLGERLAHRLAGLLERKDQAEVVATFARLLGPPRPGGRPHAAAPGCSGGHAGAVPPARGQALAAHLVEAMKSGLARRAAHPGGRRWRPRRRTRRPG